jgi:hypothetical protein
VYNTVSAILAGRLSFHTVWVVLATGLIHPEHTADGPTECAAVKDETGCDLRATSPDLSPGGLIFGRLPPVSEALIVIFPVEVGIAFS